MAAGPVPATSGEHMTDVFKYTWWALGHVYYDIVTLAFRGNVLWFLTVLPMIPVIGIPGGVALQQGLSSSPASTSTAQLFVLIVAGTLVTGLLAGPGTLALFDSTRRFVDNEDVSLRDFWVSFRKYFWRGWIVLVLDLFALYGLISAFVFYTGSGQIFVQALGFLAVYFMLLWIAAQAYLFPLVVRLDMGIRHAFRNAVVMALSSFGPSVAYVLVTLVSLVMSVLFIFPLIVFTPVTLALIGHRMTQDRLKDYGIELPGAEPTTQP